MIRTVVSLVAVAVVWATLAAIRRTPAEQTVTNRPIQIAEDGFTSSATCRACHPGQYASWAGSYHRTMTQVAAPASVRASFEGVTVADVHGAPMQLTLRDGRYMAAFDDPDWDGQGTAPRIEREVVVVTGSHHQQIYWYATGRDRLLGQLPGVYLLAERRWIPRRMAVLHPPGDPVFSETGHWNGVCIDCHSTHGKAQTSAALGTVATESLRAASTAVELGIACESCHGPAEAHVEANRNPLRRYGLRRTGAGDPSIVLPTRLEPKRAAEVCGQCHGIWEFADGESAQRARIEGLPFRPGDELRATRFVAQPTVNGDSPAMQALLAEDTGFVRDSFWPDGKVRVSGREYNGLLESPCYVNATSAERTLTCSSCHVMHKPAADPRALADWANDQLGASAESDTACTQCHAPIARDVAGHTRHAAASTGSRCYNCHMPYTTYGLLKTIRSHTVSSPSVVETTEHGRPNACNLCHVDKTLGWTATTLEQWYGQTAPVLTPDEASVSSTVLMALTGDAGQRVIAAEALRWAPAQQEAGTWWMVPVLAQLLDDPYDAVRYSAGRALVSLPALDGFAYDFVAGPRARRQRQLAAMRLWDGAAATRQSRDGAAVLVRQDGALQVDEMLRLVRQRNNRRMLLRE